MSAIAELRREAARYNTPSTYAKCAKAQRQANAKEKELAALHAPAQASWEDKVARAASTLQVSGAPEMQAPCDEMAGKGCSCVCMGGEGGRGQECARCMAVNSLRH